MTTPIIRFLGFCICLCVLACTPKTAEQTQTTTPKPSSGKPAVSTDPCATFKDSKAGEAALDAHVIYRDYIRHEQYREALPYWRQAFKAAPAADGQRTTHFDDGVKLYAYLLSQESTDAGKKIYLDSILYLYDRLGACYPENQYIDGKKAFDLYYNYRTLSDDQTIFTYFTNVIDAEGLETPAFVINPFTALLTEMFQKGALDTMTAVKYARAVLNITGKHAELIETAPCDMSMKFEKNTQGKCMSIGADGKKQSADTICCALADDIREGWPIVIGYAPVQLEAFESVPGFYPCSYFREKYYESVVLDSLACEDFSLVSSQLKRGGCPLEDPAFQALISEYQERCRSASGAVECNKLVEAEKYTEAIECYREYIKSLDDPSKKAAYNLFIAKIYYSQLRNFPKAREYARLALRDKPSMGDAYLLIGKLYASSGPLCGPGRGWDSQIVTWPAIDMFTKAASVDPSVAKEANRLIREYSKYMPSVEDIFQRQLSEGQSFTVGCWIQETTTIRAAR